MSDVFSTALHLNLFTVWQDCPDSQLLGFDCLYSPVLELQKNNHAKLFTWVTEI